MKRIILPLLALLALGTGRAIAQQHNPFEGGKLPLIPYPAEVRVGERDFDPGERLTVRVCSGDEEDFFAAATLTDELENIRTVVRKSRSGVKGAVMLTRPGLNRQADERLKQAGLELAPDFNPEGYVLLADGQGVIVSANTAARPVLWRADATPTGLSVRRRIPGLRAVAVRDAPAMRYRWQQDDWSRGPIPTLEYAKKQVRILSEYKINGYSIYAENLYQSKSHPAINPYGGTITPEEIAELIDYAARYHVEIIPQQQTFGHLHYVLRQERYADLGEKRGSQKLSPTEPGRTILSATTWARSCRCSRPSSSISVATRRSNSDAAKAKSRWPGRRTPTFTWDI